MVRARVTVWVKFKVVVWARVVFFVCTLVCK